MNNQSLSAFDQLYDCGLLLFLRNITQESELLFFPSFALYFDLITEVKKNKNKNPFFLRCHHSHLIELREG